MFEYNTSEIYLSNGIEINVGIHFRVINLVSHDIRGIIQFQKKKKKTNQKPACLIIFLVFGPGDLCFIVISLFRETKPCFRY